MSFCLESICRTCMCSASKDELDDGFEIQTHTQMIQLDTTIEEIQDDINLRAVLKLVVPDLRLEKNDKLTNNICLQCLTKAKEFYKFQRNCLKVEKELYQILEEFNNQRQSPSSHIEEFDDDKLINSNTDNEFIDENSFQSDEFVDVDDTKYELKALSDMEDFIESCSDNSIDFVLDDDSDSDVIACQNDQNSTSNQDTTPQELFPCDRCKRVLKTKISLRKHKETHSKTDSDQSKCVCHICNRGFSQAYMLRDHLRSHSGEKQFLCSECGKGLTTSSSLKQHLLRHQAAKPFTCPDCPKTFPTRTDLASHADVHKARPRKHICDECGRGFPKAFVLKKHKMSHTSERPFPCEFCSKRFITNEKLQRHTRIHTGEKPYKCKYCERAYCQSNELTKHLRCHLGENVYQCRLCPRRFPTAKIVKEHFAEHKHDDEVTLAKNLAELNAMEIIGIFCR